MFFVLRLMAKLMYQTAVGSMTYWINLSGSGMEENGARIDGMQTPYKLILEIGKVAAVAAGPDPLRVSKRCFRSVHCSSWQSP